MNKIVVILTGISFFSMHLLKSDSSIVYNFRIAETTKRHRTVAEGAYSSSSITFFEQYKHQYSGRRENYSGGLLTYIHVFEPTYLRIDWAAARIHAKDNVGFDFKNIESDDILTYFGYGIELNKRAKMTPSLLVGFPTKENRTLIEPQFGIGQVGIGTQLSGAFNFSELHPNHSIRMAGRLIYFVPRNHTIEGKRHSFTRGFTLDFLILMRISTVIEKCRVSMGYNPTLNFGASIKPNFDEVVPKLHYIRHSFFADFKHRFKIKTIASSWAMALSYGFDCIKNKIAGNKRIVGFWWSFGINF